MFVKIEIKEEPIESIIKIEEQEFETIVDERLLVEVPPKYLEALKDDTYQPIVLLERVDVPKIGKVETKKPARPPAEPVKKLKPDRKWRYCTECSARFDLKADLRSHILRTHFTGRIFECHCGAVFQEKYGLRAHERYLHSSKTSSCRICKKTFYRQDELSRHWKKHHYTDHGPLNPSVSWNCRKRDKNIIRLHHHGCYTCDKCGIEVGCFASMRAHWEKHLRPPLHQCDLCPRAFVHKSAVDYHMRAFHVKEKKFKCKKCDFSAATSRWLEEHMETYHEERKECPVCKKLVLVMSRHLKRHRIVPQCEIEKVSCPTCKRLVARKNLKGHIRTVHENLKKCDQCDEAFSSRDLKNHKLRSHYKKKLFECHCESVFKTRRSLWVHQNVAHVLVDINCKVCGMRFHKLASYNAHWRTKHLTTHGPKVWTLEEVKSVGTEEVSSE